MTAEAQKFIHDVVQHMRARFLSPSYQVLRQAKTIREDTDASDVMYWRDMMILGSVLLPKTPIPDSGIAPAFYLDDTKVRALITKELLISPRDFIHNCHVASWDAVRNTPGAPLGALHIPRRFYTVYKAYTFGWGVTLVPWQVEKDAHDSTVLDDAVVLPDFEPITDKMRYLAMGL